MRYCGIEIVFTYAATKHGISIESIRYVIEHCGLPFKQAAPHHVPGGHSETRWVYLGDDANGAALEVMAIRSAQAKLVVIHAMPLREHYRERYERVKRWRV